MSIFADFLCIADLLLPQLINVVFAAKHKLEGDIFTSAPENPFHNHARQLKCNLAS